MRGALVLVGLAIAGCYNPDLPTCSVHCTGPTDPCPGDQTCEPDLFCHEPDDTTTCEAGFLIAVTTSGNGTVTGDDDAVDCGSACQVTLAPGDSITLTATPGDDATTFTGFGGDCSGTDPCTLVADADKSVSAAFSPGEIETITVTFTGNAPGQVMLLPAGSTCTDSDPSCVFDVAQNSNVTLVATGLDGGQFNGWTGPCASFDATCPLTVGGDISVSVDFE